MNAANISFDIPIQKNDFGYMPKSFFRVISYGYAGRSLQKAGQASMLA